MSKVSPSCYPSSLVKLRLPSRSDRYILRTLFGVDFDSDAWQTAYEALSAEEHNRVAQVTSTLRKLALG